MKTNIYRGLLVLAIAAILAVIVWMFAPDDFFYPGLGLALLVTVGLAFLIYRFSALRLRDSSEKKEESKEESGATISEQQSDEVPPEFILYEAGNSSIRGRSGAKPPTGPERPPAGEVAANYFRMAALAKAKEDEENNWKPVSKAVQTEINKTKETPASVEPVSTENAPAKTASQQNMVGNTDLAALSEHPESAEPSELIISDETTLTDDDKSQLENAVWYRCENPYCKHTHFLDVHHIIEEKDGGTNKLDNLIVLCPFCHDLAHKNEIPEKEMRLWISNRQERFKFALEWHYS